MILKKKISKENGFLLIESLIALSILSMLLLVLFPLVVDWIVQVEAEKEQVELSRALYEASIDWPNPQESKGYKIEAANRSLMLSDHNNRVDVYIYDVYFKK